MSADENRFGAHSPTSPLLYDAYDQLLTGLEQRFDARGLDRNACVRFSVLISMAARLARGGSGSDGNSRAPAALGFDSGCMGALLGALDALVLECYAKALPNDLALTADADLDDVSNDAESLCAQIEMVVETIDKRLSTLQRTQNPHKRPAPSTKPTSNPSSRQQKTR
jgi:hypothetical protein